MFVMNDIFIRHNDSETRTNVVDDTRFTRLRKKIISNFYSPVDKIFYSFQRCYLVTEKLQGGKLEGIFLNR